MDSIIVKIKNGLGNQMFQYALGRHLSILNDCPLKFDITEYDHYGVNHENIELNLNKLNIVGELANSEEIQKLITKQQPVNNRVLRSIVNRFNKQYGKFTFNRRTYIKDEWEESLRILKAKPPCYLVGDWANLAYFDPIKEMLQRELSLKAELKNDHFNSLFESIENTNISVGIHFRRNYANLHPANEYFGVLPIAYYHNALDKLALKFGKLHLFIFSDNVKWVKDNFKTSHDYTIINRSEYLTDAHDFELLKRCKHQIIANSTYSWWAAYLNNFEHREVYAPKVWYLNKNAQKKYENGHLTPSGWKLI